MVSLKDLTDLMASSNLTEAQMTDLSSALTVMQKENKFSKRGKKVVLSAKMGKGMADSDSLCKDCHRTFGDTYGTTLPFKIICSPKEIILDFAPLQYQSEQD